MKFTLEIDLITDVTKWGDVRRVLRELSRHMADATSAQDLPILKDGEPIRDTGGDIVGKWEVKGEDETNPLDQAYRDAADEKFGSEGQIEIDGDAVISYGDDDGAYVAAWVWVEGELVPTPCNGDACVELVKSEDDYHGSPCGTFCNECMNKHAVECQICRDEFELGDNEEDEDEETPEDTPSLDTSFHDHEMDIN